MFQTKEISPKSPIFISGIRIDLIDFNYILNCISNAIELNKKIIINYANAYSVVAVNKEEALKSALKNSDLVHPDGTGIWLASKVLYKWLTFKKFNWTDYGFNFLKVCEENGWRIFFLGSTENILLKAEQNIKKKFPLLKLTGTLNGFDDLNRNKLLDELNNLEIDILYVGLGTPKQEIWIYNNANKLNCKVIQAVGDLFTLFAGEKIRGPKLFRQMGLEWFFRLSRHPIKYYKRYLVGIPEFIIIIIKEFLNKKSNE